MHFDLQFFANTHVPYSLQCPEFWNLQQPVVSSNTAAGAEHGNPVGMRQWRIPGNAAPGLCQGLLPANEQNNLGSPLGME